MDEILFEEVIQTKQLLCDYEISRLNEEIAKLKIKYELLKDEILKNYICTYRVECDGFCEFESSSFGFVAIQKLIKLGFTVEELEAYCKAYKESHKGVCNE